jgi:hypothetical protein
VFLSAAVFFLCITAPERLKAQGVQSPLLSGFNPAGGSRGLQLYNVTGFAGWESVVSPQGGLYLPNGTDVKGDEMMGGSASAGWSGHSERASASIQYTASYIAQVRYSGLNALSHFLGINATRRLSPKWNVGFSASSALSTYNQLLFSPMVLSEVVAVPATFDDLSSAVLAGQFTNDQLASLLTGAPLIESPARTAIFGNRVFASSASASLGYAHSTRLSINLSASASLMQHVHDTHQQDVPQYAYLIPRAIGATAGMGVSYALSPKTHVGVEASSSRGFSTIQDSYTTAANGFIGRTFGRRWFAQIHGGGGFVTNIRTHYASSASTSPVFGGNLGYKTSAHGFLAEYDRTLGQTYGAGAAQMTSISAAWNWWQPGRRWGLNSSYMRQDFSRAAFAKIQGWRASFGLTRQLGGHLVLETAYMYGSYTDASAPLSLYNSAQHAVRLSMMFSPQGRERR